jgi:hypothetical protein
MPLVQVVGVETDRSHELTGHVVGNERHRQVFSAGLADCGLEPPARVLGLGGRPHSFHLISATAVIETGESASKVTVNRIRPGYGSRRTVMITCGNHQPSGRRSYLGTFGRSMTALSAA